MRATPYLMDMYKLRLTCQHRSQVVHSSTVYVVLIPQNGALVAGPPVHVTVSRRETLDTRGALPVAIAVPVLLGLATLIGRTRRLQ